MDHPYVFLFKIYLQTSFWIVLQELKERLIAHIFSFYYVLLADTAKSIHAALCLREIIPC